MKYFVMSIIAGSLLTVGFLSHASAQCKSSSCQAEITKELYQCPMHPEVTSDKPGRCPKCNMFLEKVTESDSSHKHSEL